jgi:glutathione S-transferase
MDLYIINGSPACKSVRWAGAILGVDFNLKICDVWKGEQYQPDFLKMNPAHVVPTLNDNGFHLGERGAIMKYLVAKYAPGHDLYPDDLKKQAQIDWLLLFDVGTLYAYMREYLYPHLFFGKEKSEDLEKVFKEKLGVLEGFLGDKKYICGDKITLADLSLIATINFSELADYDISDFKKLVKWKAQLKKDLPNYALINDEGNRLMAEDILNFNPKYSEYNHLWGK